MGAWPDGRRGALCLSFDNLGEAAEIELGARAIDDPGIGDHPTAKAVLEALLIETFQRDVQATFFVEGINTELYPVQLLTIQLQGHEVAYHAWCHERWGDLSAAEQEDNLVRGMAAFQKLGKGMSIEFSGLRPPGGQLGEGGLEVLRRSGLRYCSPAGEGAGLERRVALLPFRWEEVDATCVLPQLAPVRERMTGSPDPLDPGEFVEHLEGEIGRLEEEGGFRAIVLHLSMLQWLGQERLTELLTRLRQARLEGGIWVARCADVAAHVLANPESFLGGATLDPTSWDG